MKTETDDVRKALERLSVHVLRPQDSTLGVGVRDDLATLLGLVATMSLRMPELVAEMKAARDLALADAAMLRESHGSLCMVDQFIRDWRPVTEGLEQRRANVNATALKLADRLLLPHHAFDGEDACETCGNSGICVGSDGH